MESTRPIRALARGLDALTILNSRDGATVSEVAHEIRLPRTTAYRILETLCESGFAHRHSFDDRYRVTRLVRALSGGFRDEAWVARIAKTCLSELAGGILWPVSLATLCGTDMLVRETTDHTTTLVDISRSAGLRAPLLGSAAGRAYLAFCPQPERDNLLAQLARSNKKGGEPAESQQSEWLRTLGDVRTHGYAVVTRDRGPEDEVNVAVPVNSPDRLWAVLSVRFMSSAVPLKTGLERFLPELRECAARIATLLSENQAQAPSGSAPRGAA